MNIRIDDDVPLPEPNKVDTWRTAEPQLNACEGCGTLGKPTVKRCPVCVAEWTTGKPGPITEVGLASDWVTGGTIERTTFDPPLTVMPDAKRVALKDLKLTHHPVEHTSRYPAEPTQDAKGVPTVDCYLVGGPLNGKHGPIVGSAKVVELNMYAADGSVSSIELYELGDRGDLGARYWKGTKPA